MVPPHPFSDLARFACLQLSFADLYIKYLQTTIRISTSTTDRIYIQTMAAILQMLGDFPKVCDS